MTNVTRFVGLDYHQDSVQVCVLDPDGRRMANRSVDNLWSDIAKVVFDTMDESRDVSVPESDLSLRVRMSIESCSGAADLADELIQETGWAVTRTCRSGD